MSLHDFERQLAIEQVTHYRRLQAAAANGDKIQIRRCVDQIDNLTTKHRLNLNEHGEPR